MSVQTVTVRTGAAPVYIRPQVWVEPLATLSAGESLAVREVSGEWLLITFRDRRYGDRVGYIHCSRVDAPASAEAAAITQSLPDNTTRQTATAEPPSRAKAATNGPAITTAMPSSNDADRIATADGYAEWRRADYVIVDGQRIRWTAGTRVKLKDASSVETIPLGYEVRAKGIRQADGSILARDLDARPNGSALFEKQARKSFDDLEHAFVSRGQMFEPTKSGLHDIGPVVTSGPDVDRARRILNRLCPPYISSDALRVYVVQTDVWNAAAMGNGAIWVHSGLLRDMSDDEVAVVLGHELAHYTHEHGRQKYKQMMLGRIAAEGANAAVSYIKSPAGQQFATVGAILALNAWQNGFSRVQEDQADRVGLRYAYEAGFSVRAAPTLWVRFRDRYGELDRVTNFFIGDHSRASARIHNIEREQALNYSAQK
jgi:hypothetical protein